MLAANGDCSQPISNGSAPQTLDCSAILRVAVSLRVCPICVCDVNSTQSVTTLDALLCLKKVVGQAVTLNCPACDNVTTTTIQGGPSTTSTSTSSTTTTLPVRCDGNSDCAALPPAFRCNPNTDTCEKPCTKNADCKDFYECNQTNGYCQQPSLMF